LAVRRGNAAAAARWCGAEEALRAALGMELSSARRASHERTITAVRAALGEAAFTTSWSEGRGLSADQVVAEVLAGTDTAAAEPAALDDARLSPREREVFRLLVSGHSDREIADALFITRRTASKHVSAILAKLGVPSRTAAVAFAMQSGHA
jgi:DNA-binding NarL/FixJ family response regulator